MPDLPRLIIDTNIWISLVFWPSPLMTATLDKAVRDYDIIGSQATLSELAKALAKQNLRLFCQFRSGSLPLK
jgi:predicted nucleic acid-binding protein